jgi:hypothetical protein
MDIEENKLEKLVEYTGTARQIGHTTAMLKGAIETGALVVARDNSHRTVLAQMGINPENIITAYSIDRLKGTRKPLVIDHYALEGLYFEAKKAIISDYQQSLLEKVESKRYKEERDVFETGFNNAVDQIKEIIEGEK